MKVSMDEVQAFVYQNTEHLGGEEIIALSQRIFTQVQQADACAQAREQCKPSA